MCNRPPTHEIPDSPDVIDTLADLFIARGTPAHIRSDNAPEFAAVAVKGWISGVGAKTATIEPGSLRWPSTGCAGGTSHGVCPVKRT
jgi:hypothetical protein